MFDPVLLLDLQEQLLVLGCQVSLIMPRNLAFADSLVRVGVNALSSVFGVWSTINQIDNPVNGIYANMVSGKQVFSHAAVDELMLACRHPVHRKTAMLFGTFMTTATLFSVAFAVVLWPVMWRIVGFLTRRVEGTLGRTTVKAKAKVRTE